MIYRDCVNVQVRPWQGHFYKFIERAAGQEFYINNTGTVIFDLNGNVSVFTDRIGRKNNWIVKSV